MKKILAMAIFTAICFSAVSAYNPPAGAESMYELSSPSALSGESSVAGGALYKVGPESLNVNPALTACEQRVVLNLGYTALFSSTTDANDPASSTVKFGSAMQTGILIPSKLYIFSGYLNGTFVPFDEMSLRNSFTTKFGLSKVITDKLDVGIGMNTGIAWGADNDWALGGSFGFVGKPGNISFMKDFRYGVSVLNLGKNFKTSSDIGTYVGDNPAKEVVTAFPTIGTVRGGVAATLVQMQIIKLGYAFDVTVPGFQNLIFDAGLNFCLKDMLTVSVNEKINLVESIRGCDNYVPSVGLNFKFTFDIKNKEPVPDSDEEYKENKFASYLEEKDWSESEMTVSAAYKQLYKTVTAVSTGVDINLGLKDTNPPIVEIKFLDEDEE